jgi:hypothetical protein
MKMLCQRPQGFSLDNRMMKIRSTTLNLLKQLERHWLKVSQFGIVLGGNPTKNFFGGIIFFPRGGDVYLHHQINQI